MIAFGFEGDKRSYEFKYKDFIVGLNNDDFIYDRLTVLYKNEAISPVKTFYELIWFMSECEPKYIPLVKIPIQGFTGSKKIVVSKLQGFTKNQVEVLMPDGYTLNDLTDDSWELLKTN
jgi:hypothetical protein